jgi:hypothetical protein
MNGLIPTTTLWNFAQAKCRRWPKLAPFATAIYSFIVKISNQLSYLALFGLLKTPIIPLSLTFLLVILLHPERNQKRFLYPLNSPRLSKLSIYSRASMMAVQILFIPLIKGQQSTKNFHTKNTLQSWTVHRWKGCFLHWWTWRPKHTGNAKKWLKSFFTYTVKKYSSLSRDVPPSVVPIRQTKHFKNCDHGHFPKIGSGSCLPKTSYNGKWN